MSAPILSLDHGTFTHILSSREGLVLAYRIEAGSVVVTLAGDRQPGDWVVAQEANNHSDFATIYHTVIGDNIDPREVVGEQGVCTQIITEMGTHALLSVE